ncbi:MAG: FAD-dependent oxidoreductase [Sandaracinaceae bacterium]|nr:FAD-dependent oxidoreductase [Sandaracinaceae bacterium]
MLPKPRRRPVELVAARPLSPATRELTFAVTDGEPFDYVAGQWVDLEVDIPGFVAEPGKRAYSIASAPNPSARDRFEVAVTRVEGGPVSTALHSLQIGARMPTVGPSGLFTRERAPIDAPSVFVGTGTGLSPLRAMIQDELSVRPEGALMTLIFGCRTEQDILWREEMQDLAARYARFRYEITLSRPTPAWNSRRGYVQSHLHELVDPAQPVHVYICGLTRMVTEVRQVLKEELKLDRKQVHSERYD